jgi:hypothetical protein
MADPNLKTPLMTAQAGPAADMGESKNPAGGQAAPAAAPPPAKVDPYAFWPRLEKAAPQIFKRSFILFGGLLLCQYTAMSIYCRGFAWIMYTCETRNGRRTPAEPHQKATITHNIRSTLRYPFPPRPNSLPVYRCTACLHALSRHTYVHRCETWKWAAENVPRFVRSPPRSSTIG